MCTAVSDAWTCRDFVCIGSAAVRYEDLAERNQAQTHPFLSGRWPMVIYQWNWGSEGQKGSNCGWLWMPLAHGAGNICLQAPLKQFPGTWLLFAFSVGSKLKDLGKKSPLIIMDKMIVSNDYPRCSFHQLVLFAARNGSQVGPRWKSFL